MWVNIGVGDYIRTYVRALCTLISFIVHFQCVNELDPSSPPPFEYITSRKWGEDVTLDTSPDFMLSCLCEDDCQDPTKCSCLKMTVNEFQLSKPNDLMNPTRKEKLGYQYNRLNLEKITA